MSVDWEKTAQEKFKQMIAKMPVFLRPAAEKAISEKAQSLAEAGGRQTANVKDLVDALFSQTPFGFQGMMKNDLLNIGVDYTLYGYPK